MLRLTLCQQSDALTLICKMQIFIWVLNLPLPDFLDMSVRFGSLCLHMALALVRSSLSEIDERSMNKSKAGKALKLLLKLTKNNLEFLKPI